MGESDHVVPHKEHLDKLFMRKPGLPILKVRFPDGSLQAYWNTFYQKVKFDAITAADFAHIKGMERAGGGATRGPPQGRDREQGVPGIRGPEGHRPLQERGYRGRLPQA